MSIGAMFSCVTRETFGLSWPVSRALLRNGGNHRMDLEEHMIAYERGALQYTKVAMLLHWAIAILIIFNLAFGFFMEGYPHALRTTIVSLHISSGITVLALTVLRILWRITHEPPPFAAGVKPLERHAAHLVHFFLYAAMILMPLTGWSLISAHPPAHAPAPVAAGSPAAAGSGVPASGPGSLHRIWGVIPLEPIKPIQMIGKTPGGVAPQKVLHDDFTTWHEWGGFITIALLILHIAGALKHQYIDKEREFARMGLGKAKPAA